MSPSGGTPFEGKGPLDIPDLDLEMQDPPTGLNEMTASAVSVEKETNVE